MGKFFKKALLSDLEKIFLLALIILLFIANVTKDRLDSKRLKDKDSKKETEKIKNYSAHSNENKDIKSNIKVKILRSNGKIDKIPLEEYIIGVVAVEMPAEFSMEALKAQAVASRTYAARKIKNKISHKGYKDVYICDDYKHCQAYMDVSQMRAIWNDRFNEYYDKISNAVYSTKGEVLLYQDEIIDSLYHAASGGMTEDAKEVFGENIPYLKSVVSRGEESCPKFENEFFIGSLEFVKRINASFPNAKIDVQNLGSEIKVLDRTSSKRVKRIKIGNIVMSGAKFREIFNLYSTEFFIYPTQDTIRITTRGYGHGLGMSQWGANYLAKQGKNYKEILFYYYKNVRICRVK